MAKPKSPKSKLSAQARAILDRTKAWCAQREAFIAGVVVPPDPPDPVVRKKKPREQPEEPEEVSIEETLRALRAQKTAKAREKRLALAKARAAETPTGDEASLP